MDAIDPKREARRGRNTALSQAGRPLGERALRTRERLLDVTAADFHYFQTAVDDRTAGVTAEKRRFGGQSDLGEELDLWLTHAYNAYLDFRVGYSFFVPGEAMQARFEAQDAARGAAVESHGTMAHWAYLQANVVF